jgi:AhpD family alkylhydroperoxidase
MTDKPTPTARPRLDLRRAAAAPYSALHAVDAAIRSGPLDPSLRELVKIRTSQMNGCTYCVDLHSHEALDLGEPLDRLLQLAVWRESLLFSATERAALAYTEAATALSADGVGEGIWDTVRGALDDEQLGALVMQVALMNAYNRIAVPLHMHPPARR